MLADQISVRRGVCRGGRGVAVGTFSTSWAMSFAEGGTYRSFGGEHEAVGFHEGFEAEVVGFWRGVG